MLATTTLAQDLTSVFRQLSNRERHATTQGWWMYGRTLPDARRIAGENRKEHACTLAAALSRVGSIHVWLRRSWGRTVHAA